MTRILRGVIFAFALAATTSAGAEPPAFNGKRKPYTILRPVMPAPITPIYTAKGGITNLTRFRGKIVVLNIWATWCAACLHELPTLSRLQNRLSADDLAVLSVAVDKDGVRQVIPYLKRLGIDNLPALTDPIGRIIEAFEVHEGLPWTFIIDRAGGTRGYLMGAADWDSAAARDLLKYYLSGK